MSSFIRPQARATLWRWREMLVGALVVLVGTNWALRAIGILQWLGPLVAIGGLVLIWIGWQRARFARAGDGRGAVAVVEGQVTYMGPLTGGQVALREMTALVLEAQHYPAHWRLEQAGQDPLLIPVDAAGSEVLFDAFSSLPGLRSERMLAALNTSQGQPIIIWRKPSEDMPRIAP